MYSPLNALCLCGALCSLVLCHGVEAQQFQLHIDDIVAPDMQLQGIVARVSLATPSRLELSIAQASIQGRTWRQLTVHCPQARIERGLIACPQGVLQGDEKIPFSFQYWPAKRSLELVLQPSAGERWQARLDWRGAELTAQLDIKNGKAVRLNPWWPGQRIQFSQGVFDLDGSLQRHATGRSQFEVAASLREVAFSDSAGLRAGENLGGTIKLSGTRAEVLRWNSTVAWRSGEVFWQPFYFAPGVRDLTAAGSLTEQQLRVEQGQLRWDGIGTVNFSTVWDRVSGRFGAFELGANALDLAALYPTFLRPIVPAGMLRDIKLGGQVGGQVRFKHGALDQSQVSIKQGSLQHEAKQLSFNGIDADLAWNPGEARENRIQVSGGKLNKLDIGPFNIAAKVGADRVSLAPLRIPILDGALSVDGVEARREAAGWQWTMSAALQPIAMQQLSQSLNLPTMHGTLSAIIPQVRYARQTLQVDGALLFRVFDGTVVVKDLRANELFGPTPHLFANIDMRNLDLALLTNTFSFGSMQGRLDVTVKDLEIFGWKPVRFDAKVASSPGDYPRKISQRAVQNITALGGGGGVAALQKSFLRFFDQFGYERIGLSCRLSYGVCEMDGVAEAPAGYVIVQGGGIPALTVIGYNRSVNWNELLDRLQRITQGAKPLVQ